MIRVKASIDFVTDLMTPHRGLPLMKMMNIKKESK